MDDDERAVALDERTAELAEAVGEQARDEHLDKLRAALAEDRNSAVNANGPLLRDISPPDGVQEIHVRRDRMRSATWDDGERTVAVRSMAVIPEEGEPFCVVVSVADNGDYRGVPALGTPDERCEDAEVRDTGEHDPMLPWPSADW